MLKVLHTIVVQSFALCVDRKWYNEE